MSWNREHPVLWWLTWVAAVTAVLFAVREIFGLAGAVWETLLIAWVCGVATLALVVACVQERRTSRMAGYAQALAPLHDAYHRLRDGADGIQRGDEQSYMAAIQASVTAFARAFTLITGVQCRACIKSVYSDDGVLDTIDPQDEKSLRPLKVQTLARDEATASAVRPEDEDEDYVTYNTDYLRLLLDKYRDRCFFANDLDKVPNYRNSHVRDDGRREYNATIVWPIQHRKLGPKVPDRLAVLGFLCVDTRSRGAFDQEFDFHVGAAYADTLYAVLMMLPSESDGDDAGEPQDKVRQTADSS